MASFEGRLRYVERELEKVTGKLEEAQNAGPESPEVREARARLMADLRHRLLHAVRSANAHLGYHAGLRLSRWQAAPLTPEQRERDRATVDAWRKANGIVVDHEAGVAVMDRLRQMRDRGMRAYAMGSPLQPDRPASEEEVDRIWREGPDLDSTLS